MKKSIFLFAFISIMFGFVSTSFSQLYMYPRSTAFANSYLTQSRGADVIGWNPANLGFSDNPSFSMDFGLVPIVPIPPSIVIMNNSISPYWVNSFFTGEYLDDNDKDELLGYFPADGLNISPILQMRFLGLSFGRWAVSIGAEIHAAAVIPKSLFEFMFQGNELNKPIDLSTTDVGMQSVVSLALSHGRELNRYIPYISDYTDKIYWGIGAKLLLGAGYAKIERMNSSITAYKDRFVLEGDVIGRYGLGGVGAAFDAGITVINNKVSAGLSLNNMFGFVNWGLSESEEAHYSVYSEIFSKDYENYEDLDSLLEEGVESDTVYSIDSFNSKYPSYMLLGVQYNPANNLSLYANLRQYFRSGIVNNVTPTLSIACEYRPARWLPLRLGFAVGGFEKYQFGFGFGLNFNNYALDLGVGTTGGLFNKTKGVAFSMGQKLIF
jgi:hypothetical protein